MREKSTEGECGQGAGPSAGSQAGKAKVRGAEVKASRQPLLGAAAMDGSATPIHTEEGRLAKRPPPSKGGLGWS